MKKILLPIIFIMSCTGRFGNGPDDNWPMMHWGWGFGGMSMGLLIVVLIVGLVIFILYQARDQKFGTGETPLDVLKKRYAKGDITKDEFERMKRDLSE